MKCSRSGSKMPWGDAQKIIELGDGATKYIYEKAMERKFHAIEINPTTPMKYGTKVEDSIVSKYIDDNKDLEFKQYGFISIIDGILGVSPDGGLFNKKTKENFGLEIKAPTSWNGYHDRTEAPINFEYYDFWQFQTEMLGLKAKKLISLVALPPKNAYNVVSENSEIDIKHIHVQEIEASEIAQKAIIQRAKLGDLIIQHFLSDEKMKFAEAVRVGCGEFLGGN